MGWESVTGPVISGLETFTNNKFIAKYLVDPTQVTPGRLTAVSIVGKDAIGCFFYTYQSLNNKEIPEKDRGFVAALDLANGICNVVGQLVIIKPIERATGRLYDWLFTQKKGFLRTDCLKDLSKDERMVCKGGFTTLITLVICQIFAKRVITPLFATPAAKWFVNKAKENKRKREAQNPTLIVKSSEKKEPESKNKLTDNTSSNVIKETSTKKVDKTPEKTIKPETESENKLTDNTSSNVIKELAPRQGKLN